MILHLVKKELREQAVALFVLLLVEGALIGIRLLEQAARGGAISRLVALASVLYIVVPLAATVFCQATFARELRARTILFLEALPCSRADVVLAKLSASTGVLLGLAGVGYGIAVATAWARDAIDADFALLLAARALGWTLAVYGVSLLAAVLGRYRWALYLTIGIALSLYHELGGDLARFGPIGLVTPGFETSRVWPPTAAFVSAGATYLASLAIALVILLAREGSIAILLGERMAHREKVIVAGLMIGGLFVLGAVMEKKKKEPYALTGRSVVERKGPHGRVAVELADDPGLTVTIAEEFAGSLEALADYLGSDELVPLFLVDRADLDADRFETGQLAKREGALVRANLTSGALDPDDLEVFAIRELLDQQTEGRASFEPRMWFSDGFAVYWAERQARSHQRARPARRDRLLLRALYAEGEVDLSRWYAVRDVTADAISDALAWSVVDALAEARGDEAVRAVAGTLLRGPAPRDLRALFHDGSSSAFEVIEEKTGLSKDALLRLWRGHLEKERTRLADELAKLPRLRGRIETERLSALSRGIRVKVEPTEEHATVLYEELGGFDQPLERQRFQRERMSGREARISRSFGVGARLFVALSLFVPELGCEVLAEAERRTLE